MSDYLDSNRGAMPPISGSANHSPQYLAGTGTTEASNLKPFTKDRMHVLTVGATPIRVLFGAVAGGGTDVGTTEGAILNAGSFFTFRSGVSALYVYIEAADTTSGYTASVWQREA